MIGHAHRRALAAFSGLAVVSLVVAGRYEGATEAQMRAASASVLQYHKHPTRDGHYVDATFSRANAARLQRDPSFHARLHGPTYAHPLFWAASNPSEKDLLFVATEQNDVYALDASTGTVVWHRSVGQPVPRRHLPCGNIDPLGITGTPVIDPASRTLFLAAMTTPDGGATKQHRIFALSLDDGAPRPGWPIDVAATVRAAGLQFDAAAQNQRGALALLGDRLYVPYGGHFGDCGTYHGWVVGVPIRTPAAATVWATRARGGGIWAPGGVASDGAVL